MIKSLRKLLQWVAFAVIAAISLLAVAIWTLPAYWDWELANNRLSALNERVERERVALGRLKAEKIGLADDARMLERAAREDYLLLRPGEEVYIFNSPTTGRAMQ
jgi:cell division protein FtsB